MPMSYRTEEYIDILLVIALFYLGPTVVCAVAGGFTAWLLGDVLHWILGAVGGAVLGAVITAVIHWIKHSHPKED